MGVVLDGASLTGIAQEWGSVINDVALLLPGKMKAAARKLKENAPKAGTDCSKGWLC
jgi:hypothetical protein